MVEQQFLTLHEKTGIFQHQHKKQVKLYFTFFMFPRLFPVNYAFICNRRSKVHQKNVSREGG